MEVQVVCADVCVCVLCLNAEISLQSFISVIYFSTFLAAIIKPPVLSV